MKKSLKNKLFKILLGSAIALPVVATFPSIIIPVTNNKNTSISNSSFNSAQQTKSMDFNWQSPSTTNSDQTYSFDNNENSSNNSLDAPMQNRAIDETSTSFATISSSNQTTNKKDHIAKYWLNSTTQVEQDSSNSNQNNETISIPGERQWLVKLSDLGNKINVSDESKLEITSIFYSTGGETVSKALFVIVHSSDTTTSGSFLFQIKYENDVKGDLKSQKAGSYRLAKQLSSSVSDKYNFGTIDGTSTHTMYVYKVPELTNTSGQDYTIKYQRLGNSNFGTSGIESEKTIKIENSNISSKFASSKKYKPIFTYRSSSLGGNTYIFYQIEQYDNASKDKSVVAVKINLGSNNDNSTSDITVDENNIKPIKFSTDNSFNDSSVFNTTFLEQNSSTFEIFFSQKNSKKDNSALRLTFDFDFSSSKNYETKVFDKLTLVKERYLIDVRKIYINQTSNVEGYVFLDNDNKVYKLDKNFENAKLLYDFNASTYNLGNVKRIFSVPGNGSWFAQKSDSNLVQFSNGTLIGQLDTIYKENSYELPLNVSLISQDALDPSVSYKKLSNDSNNDYDSSFKNFLNSPDAYKSFLNINFQDPRFSQNPSIKIVPKSGNFNDYSNDVKETPTNSKKYEIELHFKQTLRQIDKNGQVTNNTKEITIASQKYIFNNASGKITFAKSKDGESGFEVPAFIKNKLPSQITQEEVENYLVQYENVSNVKILSNPDDSKGQLTINVSVPYMWDGSDFKTNQNFSKVYTEFFQSDKFGNSAKVTPYDDSYFAYISDTNNTNEYEKSKRQSLLTSLKSKYSSVLPSSLSIKEMLDSFAEYGPAFKQQSNIDDGLIELPKLSDITIIPYDTEGYANININFPKIDSKQNFKVSFNTPKIFLKNKLAGTNVFFKFRDQETTVSLLESSTKLNFANINASSIASKLNSGSNSDKSIVVSYLRNFADFGNYFDKSIIDGSTIVSAEGNDSYGSLKINISDKNGSVLLPGYGKNSIENIFIGFKQSNDSSLTKDNFSFNELTNISTVSPLDVNADYLRRNNAFNFNGVNGTEAKLKDSNIQLIPSTISGTLQVVVSLENYVENNKVVPYKSFTKIYSGFRKSKDSVDMIVWKSINEINSDNPGYSNNRPSVIINTINDSGNNKSDLDKLKVFSNISNDLEKSINDSNGSVSIIMSPDDSRGILNISASITINGQLTALNTSISGFANDGTLTSSVIFDSPEIKQALSQFQKDNRTPSSITKEEASKLYELKNASWYSKDVTLVPDDAKGTLLITVMILDKDGNQILDKPASNEFLGFTKFIPTDTGTNWGIVAASTIVPAIVFIIPIAIMGIYQERIQMKRISRLLDKRLTEEYKKLKKQ